MYETTLEEFQQQAKTDRAKYNAICAWHLQAFSTAGIPLPYRPNSTGVTIDYDLGPLYENNHKPAPTPENPDNWEYCWERKPDTEKIVAMLKKVAKFARTQGYKIEKDYRYDFSLQVTIPIPVSDSSEDEITIEYSCNREVVCTKKVVGTKVTPAHTVPERIEEEVEWDCQKIALTA